MKYSKFILIIIVALFAACEEAILTNQNDCVFEENNNMDGIIDSTEWAIMNDCTENAFTSKNEIENNLIGEWKLIGHGEGWVHTISQPCAYVTVLDDALILEYESGYSNVYYVDTVTLHSWQIEEVNWSGGQYFNLTTTPYAPGLYINQFCTNYMYGDATPSDGNMYLYEKVE